MLYRDLRAKIWGNGQVPGASICWWCDKASKVLFAYPTNSKEVLGVAKNCYFHSRLDVDARHTAIHPQKHMEGAHNEIF